MGRPRGSKNRNKPDHIESGATSTGFLLIVVAGWVSVIVGSLLYGIFSSLTKIAAFIEVNALAVTVGVIGVPFGLFLFYFACRGIACWMDSN